MKEATRGQEPAPVPEGVFEDFLKGGRKIFSVAGGLGALPGRVGQWLADRERPKARKAAERLGEALLSKEAKLQPEIVDALAGVIDQLSEKREKEVLLALSHKLIVWIILETDITPAYQRVCDRLKILCRQLILDGRFAESDHVLETFYIIRTGKLKKSSAIRKMAGEALDAVATDDVLDLLLDEFQTDERGRRNESVDCLLHLGNASAGPLLGLLRWSPSRYERSRILQVLGFIGTETIPALERELKRDQPWFYMRNLVLLAGRIGDAAHVSILQPLLRHKDIRVQREALASIRKLGGKGSEAVALSALHTADDRLKVDLVEMLGGLESKDAVPWLLENLESAATGFQDIELVERICHALGRIGAPEAAPALNLIVEASGKPRYNEKIGAAAAGALALIKQKTGQAPAPALTPRQMHMQLWDGLYSVLSKEEREAFYGALKEARFPEDHLICRQGSLGRTLYFIEEGDLVLAYDQEDEEVWVKTLRRGQIAGADSFFSTSVTTTALRAITDSRLYAMEKTALDRQAEDHPHLTDKLREYCFELGGITQILEQYGMERRIDPRAEIDARVSLQFLDADDRPGARVLRGILRDISAGGLAALIRIDSAEAAGLVGRRIKARMLLPVGEQNQEIDQNGAVVAIFDKAEEGITLHMKFDWRLTRLLDVELLGRVWKEVAADPEETLSGVRKDDFLVTRFPK